MNRYHRRIIAALRSVEPKISVTEVNGRNGHIKLKVASGDKQTTVTTAGSPKCEDIAMRNACREICKKLDIPCVVF